MYAQLSSIVKDAKLFELLLYLSNRDFEVRHVNGEKLQLLFIIFTYSSFNNIVQNILPRKKKYFQ